MALSEVSTIYQKAKNLSNYKFYYGNGCILEEKDFCVNQKEQDFNLHKCWDETVLSLIENRVQKATELYMKTVKSLCVMTPNDCKIALSLLIFKIKSSLRKFDFENQKYFNDILDFIDEAEYIEEVNEKITNIFSNIGVEIEKMNSNKPDEFSLNVIAFIENNYSNINLCREMIADKFNISVKYADFLFKKSVLKTISNYIKEYRMDMAKKLMETTPFNINKISQMVGYSSDNQFIYSFKKEFGITPGEYKKTVKL